MLLKNLQENTKRTAVASLKFCFEAQYFLEKLFWLSLGIFGTVLIFGIVNEQIESWHENPIVGSQIEMPLDKIEFPAITFCHKGNTRFGVAERMMDFMKDQGDRIRSLRNLLLRTTIGFLMSQYAAYKLAPRNIFYEYLNYCHENATEQFCDVYDTVFSYSMLKNTTAHNIQGLMFEMLKNERNISEAIPLILQSFKAQNVEMYNVSEYLHRNDAEWLNLQFIFGMYDFSSTNDFKIPINLGRAVWEQIDSMFGEDTMNQWREDDLNELHNYFSLPDLDLNLIAIAHLYTMNDFHQFAREDLFDYQRKLYIGII